MRCRDFYPCCSVCVCVGFYFKMHCVYLLVLTNVLNAFPISSNICKSVVFTFMFTSAARLLLPFCWRIAMFLGALSSPTWKQAMSALTQHGRSLRQMPVSFTITLWYLTTDEMFAVVCLSELFHLFVFFFMYYGLHVQQVALPPSAAVRNVCRHVRPSIYIHMCTLSEHVTHFTGYL